MNLEQIKDLLNLVPFFRGLPPDCLEKLAEITREHTFMPKDPVFIEGEEAAGMYIVLAGRLYVYKLSPDGKEQILKVFESMEVLGEAAVFSGHKFPAHASALEETRCLILPRTGVIRQCRETPDLALSLLDVLSGRLRHFVHLVESLSLQEVPTRLAVYLLYLSARKDGAEQFDLEIPKGRMAAMLGTLPETLSRAFGKMAKEGLVKTDGSRGVQLLDRNRLQDLADGEWRLR
jgi:CRP/FNR family transcriptional regulator, dissimilatory nitrate respiration regulator